jgi:hypothetical protein
VSAREGKEVEGGTDGARKTAAVERFTSAAAEGAAARLAGRIRVQGAGFLCGGAGGEGGREDAEGLLTGVGERQMVGDGAAAGFTAAAQVRRSRGAGLVRVRKRECARLDHAFIG